MNDKLAQWLAKEIEDRGWSIRETGRRAGLSHTPIANILAGQANPGLTVLVKLADVFGASREDVLRLAGVLPPLPGIDEDATLRRMIEIVKRLSPEDREEVLAYARYRYEQRGT
jgi:transcriptional regulator with XRE-family HTH domain